MLKAVLFLFLLISCTKKMSDADKLREEMKESLFQEVFGNCVVASDKKSDQVTMLQCYDKDGKPNGTYEKRTKDK